MKNIFTALVAGAALMAASGAVAQEIRIGIAQEPSSIDPHFHNLGPNNGFLSHIYERMVEQDSKQRLRPGLAVSWKPISETVWEFKLRKGVKWHDGSPFTADDVVFTAERAVNVPNSPSSFGTYLKGKTFTKIDDYTVHVSTPKPYPLMATEMSTIMIISKKNAQGAQTKDFNLGPAAIGTGPYKFVKWQKGDFIEFARNDDYWGGRPNWSKVILKPISSAPTRVAALLAGDVDMIDGVPTADIETLKGNPKVKLSQGISNRVIYLHLDQKRDNSPFVTDKNGNPMDKNPLKDVRVRKAISKLINRPAIVEKVMEGIAIPAGQLVSETFFGNTPNLKPEAFDPAAAKKLLGEAGWGDGFGLTIHGPNNRYINDAKIAEAIAQMLTRGGIVTKVVTMPKNVYFKRASRGGPENSPEFSFILVGWGSGTGEASSPLKSLLMTYDKSKGHGASNRGRHSNPKMDALVVQALATVDDAKRKTLLQKATEVGIGEDQGIIPLHYQVNTWATRPGLRYDARTDERTLAMDIKVVK
jgi:peptide/nickel transport system substrate-binding protein